MSFFRVILLVALTVPGFAGDAKPWDGQPYRQQFDQLLTDGRYLEAEANARQILAAAEMTKGPDSIETALALDLLTEVTFWGDHLRDPEAEQIALRAIAVKEKIFGPIHSQVAVSDRMMGDLLAAKADYERARVFFERAVAIHEQTPQRDPRQESQALEALGFLMTKSGEFAEAHSAFERAMVIRDANFSPDSPLTAIILSNYAVLLREMGDYEGARSRFLRADTILEKKIGQDHVVITDCLTEFGALLIKMGRPAEAKAVLERALAIEEKAYVPSHVGLAFVLNNLATASANLGEFLPARGYYERAIAIATNVYGIDHPDVARILAGYAALLERMNDHRGALEAALRAEQIGRDHAATTIRTVPERQALRWAATRPGSLDLLMRIAAADPAARGPAFDALVRSRAMVFDEMAARHRAAAQTNDPETEKLVDALTGARSALSRLVVQGPVSFRASEYAAVLNRARLEKDRAERALAGRSASFREELARRGAGAREVTAALQEGEALVSFVRYGTDPAYLAFVQRAGAAEPIVVCLGQARRIEAQIVELRHEIELEAEAPGRSETVSEARYRVTGTALRKELWDPLEPALAGAKRVFLTPDDALNRIDFAALPARNGGYLVEHGPVLHYVSAERDLLAPSKSPSGKGLLAMGAPAFDRAPRDQPSTSATTVFRGSRSSCPDFRTLRFEAIPGSFREVRDIGAVWNKNASGAVTERTGDRASGAGFIQDAPGKRVLHVAAHGFVLSENCRSLQAMDDNPLLLSGLALAGANLRVAQGAAIEDGILTAEEIATLDLDGVEWAVLSGCETGLGKLLAGEGVFGLRRAFQVAGARTVITSLWPVSDEATAQWMSALYRKRFLNRMDTAQSVHAASLEILAARRKLGLSTHPFYWSGFIAIGDWR